MRTAFYLCQGLAFMLLAAGCRAPQSPGAAPAPANAARTGSAQPAASKAAYQAPDPLVALNQLFLNAYKERQTAVKAGTSPLIVANFSTLELYWHGTAETNRIIPDIYQALKVVDHVPFGIYLRVLPHATDGEAAVPDSALAGLKACQTQIEQAEGSLSAAGFSDSELVRQQQILSASLAYLTNVIAAGRAPRGRLMAFARSVGPLMLENANEAAAAELEMSHAVVLKWKARIPADDWQRLVVVVRGLQMPRRMNILTQYFAKLLGQPSHNLGYPLESRRLIYAEFIPNGRDHLDLMATTFIDGDASEAFFGDRWRMSRDVLADGAEEYLKKLNFESGGR